jgi:hypothetical protein
VTLNAGHGSSEVSGDDDNAKTKTCRATASSLTPNTCCAEARCVYREKLRPWWLATSRLITLAATPSNNLQIRF